MNAIRWGIIGCGDVTEVKSGPGFQQANRSALVAVMRRNGALAEDYARRHQVPKWYDRAEDLIHDPEVDAIYIATPPANHKEYAIMAAEAGKPAYVEKPMARNSEECDEMIRVFREKQLPLFVAYYRRAHARILKIKELLETEAIGKVRFVTTVHHKKAKRVSGELPWRLLPDVAGGGLFFDVASHTLDALDFLLGPISDVMGRATNEARISPAEDMLSASYLFPEGVHGTGLWCFCSYMDGEVNEIIGTRGKISFATFGETFTIENEQGLREVTMKNPPHVQQPLIQTVVDELLGLGTCPSTGESAARTNRVMDQIVRSYYNR